MKNYSRAYNRHQQRVKFLRRVNIWFAIGFERYTGERKFYKNLTLQGKHHTFLKTTARPCNCDGCTYKKYKRPTKSEIKKLINNQL